MCFFRGVAYFSRLGICWHQNTHTHTHTHTPHRHTPHGSEAHLQKSSTVRVARWRERKETVGSRAWRVWTDPRRMCCRGRKDPRCRDWTDPRGIPAADPCRIPPRHPHAAPPPPSPLSPPPPAPAPTFEGAALGELLMAPSPTACGSTLVMAMSQSPSAPTSPPDVHIMKSRLHSSSVLRVCFRKQGHTHSRPPHTHLHTNT